MHMIVLAANCSIFALFNLGDGEVLLILALILILFGAKRFRGIGRGFGEGFSQFRKSVGRLTKELDQEAHDAGESLGGIYGKPAAQALTPNNRTTELYDPAVFREPREKKRMRFRGRVRWWWLRRRSIFEGLKARWRGRK
jgi:Sec-independent protein translocase protein TatA